MPFSIKSKVATGIGVLFGLLLVTTAVAFLAINLLSRGTENLLTANYKSIRYCNKMMHSIDILPIDSAKAVAEFESALRYQEHNITEPGEGEATQNLRRYFDRIIRNGTSISNIDSINSTLYEISGVNQKALEQKNKDALEVASNANFWLSILATLVFVSGFTLAVNLPATISGPLKQITDGIREISKKNYRKRIQLNTKDEFGAMADAFNSMAEQLYEWEHSNYAQLSFEKSRVDSIISQMDDAVLGLDAEGRILFLNDAAAGLFNLDPQQLSGRPATEIARTNDLFDVVLQGSARGPLKIIVNGKEQFFVLNRKSVVREGKQLGDVYSLKNITQFKELDLSKTNLLATISHELKTPISSIKMSAQLLNDDRTGGLNQDQREMVQGISEDAERLLRLTGELLNMTQLETGNIQLRFQHVSAKNIADEAIAAVSMQSQQKGIMIQADVPSDLPHILADPEKTALVLVNLLNNAIKYSPERAVIHLNLRQVGKAVSFEVKDEGEGIDPTYQPHIFDRYFKVPGSINRSGTGLGLAISKEFIEAQGGGISVESTPGKGSIFRFELPVA
jgi:signal transduction histidine kinase